MLNFSTLTIVILTAVGLIAAAAVVLYQLAKMRDELKRATSIMKDFQKLHPGFITLLQQLDSVGRDCEAQKVELQFLCKRIESGEAHLAESDARIAEILDGLAHIVQEVGRKPQDDSALMRKGILSQDLELRFNLLKDWLSKNSLAILRRAAHEPKTANDLINIIPPAFEPEAEILEDRVLLVGTRSYPDKYAIMLGDMEPGARLRRESNAIAS